MSTNAILRKPVHTVFERALGSSILQDASLSEEDVTNQEIGNRIWLIIAVQAILNLLAVTFVALTASGFIGGNNELGVWALGPALAGIVGVVGFQVRTTGRFIRRQTSS